MSRRILVPTDGSAGANAAVDAAIGFAHDSAARIIGLHVTSLPSLLSEGTGVIGGPENGDVSRECLGYLQRRAAQAHVPAEVLLRRADTPSDAILATARELQCDLIVMGAHGRNAALTHRLGSQTSTVLAHGPIPVLVVPLRRQEG